MPNYGRDLHNYHPLFLPQLTLFGDIHNNVEVNLIVKRKSEVLLSDMIVIQGDLIIDHDDTKLLWSGRHLKLIEEHSQTTRNDDLSSWDPTHLVCP